MNDIERQAYTEKKVKALTEDTFSFIFPTIA